MSTKKNKPVYRNLTFQVIVAMALGIALGFLAPELATKFKIFGDIFLKLIKTVVAPWCFLR